MRAGERSHSSKLNNDVQKDFAKHIAQTSLRIELLQSVLLDTLQYLPLQNNAILVLVYDRKSFSNLTKWKCNVRSATEDFSALSLKT